MSISLPCVGQAVYYHFFRLSPGHRKGLEGKIYPAMDLLVHGESDGINFVLVEDCICKL